MFFNYVFIMDGKKNGIRRSNKLKFFGFLLLLGGPYVLLYYHLSEGATQIFYVNDDPDRVDHLRPINFSQGETNTVCL